MSESKVLRLSRPHELGALVSPSRVEVLELLQSHGPASIAELARELGRKPQALYYHVETLRRAGLVEVRGRRRVGRREESVFALAAERIEIPRRSPSLAMRKLLARSATAVVRRAERELRRSIVAAADGEPSLTGGRRVRLDADGERRVRAALERLDRLLAREHRRGGERSYLCTFVLTPIATPGRAVAR